jgi:Mlc titration factor MtfA (ptsG expression regulator)
MRRVRREKLFKTPLDASRVAILQKHVTLYSKLPQTLREELHGHINVFLDEKKFIGRDDIALTDEIRVVVAGNACLLLLQGFIL